MSVRLATATTDSGASRASRTNPRDHKRDVAGRRQPSLRDRQRLQAGERGLRAGAAANIGGRVGEIGELAERQL